MRVATDVGGTFTDFVVMDEDVLTSFKVPSTPESPDLAVAMGLEEVLRGPVSWVVRGPIELFSHGTTVATNTVLQRSGAEVALVVTEGFEDLLEIGRQTRPSVYDPRVARPEPLTPSRLRFGVRERVAADGSVVTPLQRTEARRVAAEVAASGAGAAAVCLLHSYLVPDHERMMGEELGSAGVEASLSSEVRPVFREVERASTTSIDAHVRPVVGRYLCAVRDLLREHDLEGFMVMGSHGGVLPDTIAAQRPARLLLSGPAGGVMATAALGARAGVEDLFSFDMGGTSTDVGAVVGGAPLRRASTEVAGLEVGLPTIDVVTVGAGGGSYVWVDDGGALRVGPRSAGADPGPAWYGSGGDRATVTDVHALSGLLPWDMLERYGLRPDREAARAACETVADAAGMDLEAFLLGARRVADATMSRAFRVLIAGRGLIPRDFILVAFGGAGPLHGASLARELGFPRLVVPASAGAFSATGIALSDTVVERDRTLMLPLGEAAGELADALEALRAEASGELASAGLDPQGAAEQVELDMRYAGQSHELAVPLPQGELPSPEDFHLAHQRHYGHSAPGEAVELVNARLRLVLRGPSIEPRAPHSSAPSLVVRSQGVLFDDGWLSVAIIPWTKLEEGPFRSGPFIVAGAGETVLVTPDTPTSVDGQGNIWMEVGEGG